MLRNLAALALVGVSAGRAALGQTPAQQLEDSLARGWLEQRISGQALIRVRGSWGSVYLDQPRLVGDTLTYAASRTGPLALPRPLSLDAIDQVQVRGSAAGTGALIGAGIGFAGGLAAGLGLAASLCNSGFGSCSNETGGVALITLASTAGGALVGALVGAPLRKWKTVYRTPN